MYTWPYVGKLNWLCSWTKLLTYWGDITLFMVFSIIYPILRHVLGYIDDQQPHHLVSPRGTLAFQVALLMSWYVQIGMRCIIMFHNGLQIN